MSTEQKIYALKGDFYSRVAGTKGAFQPFLNATDGSITMNIETIKQMSNGDDPGVIAEDEVSREATLTISVQSRHRGNLEKALYANSVTVEASAAPIEYTFPVGNAGDVVKLPVANITTCTIGTLVEGVDYRIKPLSGAIQYLKTTAETQGTYEHGTYVNYGLLSADTIRLEILYTSEKTGTSHVFYHWNLAPAATFQLISGGNEFSSQQLTGTLLNDPSAPRDGNMGQIGRITSIG